MGRFRRGNRPNPTQDLKAGQLVLKGMVSKGCVEEEEAEVNSPGGGRDFYR